ncbi:MAG: hypothetical protein JNK82_38660 [Myxococcaceae bacterium]|nr:hypothetical protein [Myxococcaceae bacterium]
MKRFSTIALMSAGAAAAAVTVVFAMPLEAAVRADALLGIGISAASGGLALVLKRRAVQKNGITAALTAVVVMFLLRILLLGAALTYVIKGGGNEVAAVAGFFAVYFVQQALELSWVVAAAKTKEVPAT